MTAIVAPAIVARGILQLQEPTRFAAALQQFLDGTAVTVRIERAYRQRSTQQNKFYWGTLVHAIAEHTGFTPGETHDVLKQMFLPQQKTLQDKRGVVIHSLVIGGTTTRLSTLEFTHYCDRIRVWAMEYLELVISDRLEGVQQ